MTIPGNELPQTIAMGSSPLEMARAAAAAQPVPRRARTSRAGARGAPVSAWTAQLYSMDPRTLWTAMKAQPASFWLLQCYLFFEYVRPQEIYSLIESIPWGKIFIVLTLVAYLMEGGRFRFRTGADWLLGLFSLVVLASSATAVSPETSFSHLWDYFAWVVIYVLITNRVDSEDRLLLFMAAFFLWNFKMSQHATRQWASMGFGFDNWGLTGAPGWFQNSGEYGIEMTIYVPLVAYFVASLRSYWGKWAKALGYAMVVTAVLGTIGCSSRGAVLGLGIAAFYMLMKTRHKMKGIVLLGLLVVAFFFLIPPEAMDRFQSMGTDKTSLARKTYWTFGLQVIRDHPILGIGFKNWQLYFRQHMGYSALPHNVFIEAGAELGYMGLAAFVLLIVCTLVMNYRTRKLLKPLGDAGRLITAYAHGLDAALIGFMVSGSFVTVLYYPFFWINLAMTVAVRHAALNRLRAAGMPASSKASRRPRLAYMAPAPRPAGP